MFGYLCRRGWDLDILSRNVLRFPEMLPSVDVSKVYVPPTPIPREDVVVLEVKSTARADASYTRITYPSVWAELMGSPDKRHLVTRILNNVRRYFLMLYE